MQIPKHIAVIMDGNGRWAKRRMLPKKFGHQKGLEAAENLVKVSKKYGVKFLTLYAFSSENWKRSKPEVDDLMKLLKNYLKNNAEKLISEGAKINFIGGREQLPEDIKSLMKKVEEKSSCNKFTLTLAISYGARDEIRNAAFSMAKDIVDNNRDINNIDFNEFDRFIDVNNVPHPDLLIRTSGEHRLSNFLLWQLAYTELYFTDTLWPDFTEDDFLKAVRSFDSRERRYGK